MFTYFTLEKIVYIVIYILGKFSDSMQSSVLDSSKDWCVKLGVKSEEFFGGYLLGVIITEIIYKHYGDYIQTRCTKIGMVSKFLNF
jgi:hypothetical protein